MFGTLEFDSCWVAHVFVPMLNKSLRLELTAATSRTPNQTERDHWQKFMAQQPQLKKGFEAALFEYYTANLEQFRMPFDEDEEESFAPTLQNPSEIWDLLEPLPYFWMIEGNNGTPYISLEFTPRWDEEHGVVVELIEDQIGISEGGTPWHLQDRYGLDGQRFAFPGEPT